MKGYKDKFLIEKYNFGGTKGKNIVILFKKNFGSGFLYPENLEIIAKYNKINLYIIDSLDEGFFDQKTYRMNQKEFEDYYNKNQEKYEEYYKYLKSFIKSNNIDLAIFCANLIPYKPHFLEELKRITKIASRVQDDDVEEVANRISKPYVKFYDFSFCSAVYYKGDKVLMKEKYKEWGAKNTEFIPLGLYYHKFDENWEVKYDNRDIDVIYIGGFYFKKILRIFKLKKHFGDRMHLYGKGRISPSKWKNALFKILLWWYNIGEIKPLTQEQFINVYQRSKIGFNLHQEYGPTNARMYELPGNGVMQICDNQKGLGKIFKLNEEAVGYKTLNEAIKKIEYYLSHDDERIKIAKAGYNRVQNYKVEKCFAKILETVFH